MYRLRQDVNVLVCTPGRLSDFASHDPEGGNSIDDYIMKLESY